MEFKVGDKVKIPKSKSNGTYNLFKEEIKDYKEDFLYITYVNNTNVSLGMSKETCLGHDNFEINEIELYEEEFPEKWFVRSTPETRAILVKWREGDYSGTKEESVLLSDKYWVYIRVVPSDYKEITFDQFKKHILKEKEIMKKEIKVGSKVLYKGKETVVASRSSSSGSWIIEYPLGWYGKDRSFKELDDNTKYCIVPGSDLTLIEESTMKNLLETEFVIENCTLSQRLAIKAYCDEKEIKYASKHTFQDKTFNSIVWDKIEFLNYTNNTKDGRIRITFSELIQFLDQYQPEPEFKVGDIVVFEKKSKEIMSAKKGMLAKVTALDSFLRLEWLSNTTQMNGGYNHEDFRHATPEEIKKWKEENEIKLPKISDYNGLVTRSDREVFLNWGCTQVSISTIKELLEAGLDHITIKGHHIIDSEIKQIKKFIEHNKL